MLGRLLPRTVTNYCRMLDVMIESDAMEQAQQAAHTLQTHFVEVRPLPASLSRLSRLSPRCLDHTCGSVSCVSLQLSPTSVLLAGRLGTIRHEGFAGQPACKAVAVHRGLGARSSSRRLALLPGPDNDDCFACRQ